VAQARARRATPGARPTPCNLCGRWVKLHVAPGAWCLMAAAKGGAACRVLRAERPSGPPCGCQSGPRWAACSAYAQARSVRGGTPSAPRAAAAAHRDCAAGRPAQSRGRQPVPPCFRRRLPTLPMILPLLSSHPALTLPNRPSASSAAARRARTCWCCSTRATRAGATACRPGGCWPRTARCRGPSASTSSASCSCARPAPQQPRPCRRGGLWLRGVLLGPNISTARSALLQRARHCAHTAVQKGAPCHRVLAVGPWQGT